MTARSHTRTRRKEQARRKRGALRHAAAAARRRGEEPPTQSIEYRSPLRTSKLQQIADSLDSAAG